MADIDTQLDNFLDLLKLTGIPSFPSDKYAAAFQNACKALPYMKSVSGAIPDAPRDVSFDQNKLIDGQDVSKTISVLALCALARCMANGSDGFGFHQCANGSNAYAHSFQFTTDTFTLCYGDYLNNSIRLKGGKPLQDASYTKAFQNAFRDALLNPSTQLMAELTDQTKASRDYTINLLFVYSYWFQGRGFRLVTDYNAAMNDPTSWVYVVRQWTGKVASPPNSNVRPLASGGNALPPRPLNGTGVVHAILNLSAPTSPPSMAAARADGTIPLGIVPNAAAKLGNISQLSGSFKTALVASGVSSDQDDDPTWQIGSDLDSVASFQTELFGAWDSRLGNFSDAVHKAVNAATSKHYRAGGARVNVNHVRTTYGLPALNLMDDAVSSGLGDLFTGRPHDNVRIDGQNPDGSGSCFKPGTEVMTKDGKVPIETLHEGLELLTRGGAQLHYGICSDEQVRHSTTVDGKKMHLFGFNDEEPFFTASHVFHTSTGLRAIDPVGARIENPWLKVGHLEVGHLLLHTVDGHSYKPVLIERFSSAEADCEYVYGVHMHDGLRSYHANGYLTHANYPEITLTSISKLLKSMPRTQRLKIMTSMKELKPLFARFGAHTLLDLLDVEIKDPSKFVSSAIDVTPRSAKELDINSVVRVWEFMFEQDNTGHDDAKPINASLAHGVFSIDKTYCKIASVQNRTISWSRQLGSFWEHGSFTLDRFLVGGHGWLMYSQTQLCEDPTLFKKFIIKQVELSNDAHESQQTGSIFSHVKAVKARSNVVLPDMMQPSDNRAPKANGVPIGGDYAFANGHHLDGPKKEVAAAKLPSVVMNGDVFHGGVTRVASRNTVPSVSPRKGFQYTPISTFGLSYDPTEYQDNQDAPKGTTTPFSDLVLAHKPRGIAMVVRIKALDDIRDAMMLKSDLNWPRDLELYNSELTIDKDSHMSFQIRVTRPDLIALAADQNAPNQSPHGTMVYDNLTFKNAGCNVVLPFVPSIFVVKINATGNHLIQPSVIRRYDTTMVGQIGARHLLAGSYKRPQHVVAMVKAASTATIGPLTKLTGIPTGHTAPVPAVKAFAASVGLGLDDDKGCDALTELSLDTTELHSRTQSLLYRTMVYHMNDTDRESFTDIGKPAIGQAADQVVPELADALDDKTKTWLEQTYTKAWITQRLVSLPSQTTKQWQRQLTGNASSRVDYFFTGKGAKCMAKAPEYNRLNELASNAVIKQLCPDLVKYINDGSKGTTANAGDGVDETIDTRQLTGGKRWASALFNSFALGAELDVDSVSQDGCDKLRKVCNFISVLDPIPTDGSADPNNPPLAIRLGEAVQKSRESQLLNYQFDASASQLYQEGESFFLYDAMKEIWTNLLNGVKGFGGDDVTDQLHKDAQKILDGLGISEQLSAQAKAKAMTDAFQNIIADQGKIMRGGSFAYKWFQGVYGKGLSGASAMSEAAISLSEEPKMSKVKFFGMGVMTLATAAMFVSGSLSAFRMWPDLSPADRAKLILSAVQTVMVMLDNVRQMFGESISKAFLTFRVKKMAANPKDFNSEDFPADEVDDKTRNMADANLDTNKPRTPEKIETEQGEKFGGGKVTIEDGLKVPAEKVGVPPAILEQESMAVKTDKTITANAGEEDGVLQPETKAPEKPPTEKEGYNIGGNVLKMISLACDLGLAILTGFQIYASWKDSTVVDKVLNIASMIQQTLSVVVEVVNIAVDIGIDVMVGLSAFCAIAGPVLAIIGIVLMFVMMFLPKPPPPLTPLEKWIEDVGNPFVAGLPDPPPPRLHWNIHPSNVPLPDGALTSFLPASSKQTITITGANTTTQTYKFDEIEMSFANGSDKNCLFSDAAFKVQGDTSNATGVVSMKTSGNLAASSLQFGLTSDNSDTASVSNKITIQRALPAAPADGSVPILHDDDLLMVMPPGSSVSIVLSGTIGAKADDPYRLTLNEDFENGGDVVEVRMQIVKI